MSPPSTFRSRLASASAPGAMILGILAVYCPPGLFRDGGTLSGFDYVNLHARRIRYFQEAVAGGGPSLPAWHTRELLGAPFWSNVQSFPFLPTRLLLLPLDTGILYPVAVNLAAVLAAVFTYLYGRRIGLGRIAAATAGWTFAASGFFASRILVGHLPLLEVFGALPLLLWAIERIAQADPGSREARTGHLPLALATFCVVLAGHPQIPAYAVAAAGIYALARIPGRRTLRALLAMAGGVLLSGFVGWPMLRLIGRSTRVLSLEHASNDVPLPFWRLRAFVLPWADGWPPAVGRFPAHAFAVPDNPPLFWDTVGYVGLLPLVAVALLSVRGPWRTRLPRVPWRFLAAVTFGAVLLALPILPSGDSGGTTLLRSSSRLIYVTTFGLAVATGAIVDLLFRAGTERNRRIAAGVGVLVLVVHAFDLGSHDRPFVKRVDRRVERPGQLEAWRRNVGDGRVAFDHDTFPANPGLDDVAFFDSIMLAPPYRALLAMLGLPPATNVQRLYGASLSPEVLASLCVHQVVTRSPREDLPLVSRLEGSTRLYSVPNPSPRAVFVPDAEAEARSVPEVRYARPDSDHMILRVSAPSPGRLRVVESFDEGWKATVDGSAAEVLLEGAFAMAVRVEPGEHEVRLEYETPGWRIGLVVSALGAAIVALAVLTPRRVAAA